MIGKWIQLALFCLLVACGGDLQVDEPRPVAQAGMDQLRYLHDLDSLRVGLDGRASCDPLGAALDSATWSVLTAPPGTEAELADADHMLRHGLVVKDAGTYLVGLVVKKGDRASLLDVVEIEVRDGQGEDRLSPPPLTNACGEILP